MSKRTRNSLNVSNNEGSLEPAEIVLPDLPDLDLTDIGFEYTLRPESDADEFKEEITQGGFIASKNFKDIDISGTIYHKTHTAANPCFLEMNGTKYYVENYLGGGTFGKVYKVYDADKNVYAMKEMPFNEQSQNQMEGIMNHILHTLYGSEYVPKVYGIGASDDAFYMINEMIEGISVSSVIARTPESDKEKVVKQMLYIVSTLLLNINAKPIQFVHGDFKPDNLMFDTTTKQIKIIDFGFSRLEYGDVAIITAPEFNMTYKEGRDLTSLMFILYHFLLNSPEFLKPMLKAGIYDLSKKKDDLANLYKFLNVNDMPKGYPEYVQRQFKNFTAASGGGVRTKARSETRKSKQRKRHTRKMRGGRALPLAPAPAPVAVAVAAAYKEPPSAAPPAPSISKELIWHGERDTMNAETLASLLTQAQVAHADTIAELYYEEKDPNLQLNLLRTLIFFKEQQPGVFEEFVQHYRSKPDARPFLVSTIHWDARIL